MEKYTDTRVTLPQLSGVAAAETVIESVHVTSSKGNISKKYASGYAVKASGDLCLYRSPLAFHV